MKKLSTYFMLFMLIIFIGSCSNNEDEYNNENEIIKRNISITKFSINGNDAIIDSELNRITLTVPFGTDITMLKPHILASENVTIYPESDSKIDFTDSVVYTITDNINKANAKKYTAKISKKENNESKIISFSINGENATIDESKKTISLTLPYSDNTDITSLIPNIKVSDNATIIPNSSIKQNFSAPVSYEVTAENGLKSVYVVSVLMESFDAEITNISPNLALSGDIVTIKGKFAPFGNKVYYDFWDGSFVKKEVSIINENTSEIKIIVPDITYYEGLFLTGGTLRVISNKTESSFFSVEFYDKDKTIIEKINKTSFKIGDSDEVIILTGRNLKAKNPNHYSITFTPVIQGLGNSHKYATSSDFKVNESGTELTFSTSNGIHAESNQYYLEITGNTQSNKVKVSFKK